MKKANQDIYRCPYSKSPLLLKGEGLVKNEIASGVLFSDTFQYQVKESIPHFYKSECLTHEERHALKEYDTQVSYYDNAIEWLFESFYENEATVRNKMVDLLELNNSSKVLEVACGTGRDSGYIASRLGKEGEFYLQDISEKMVVMAKEKLENKYACNMNFFISSASNLPFPDHYLDGLYTFGGFNEFSNPIETLKEFSRIVKVGGKIVFGDENVAPWLDNTEYAEIIKANNPIFRRTTLPINFIPENAEDVKLQWVIGKCFYIISFNVGEKPPRLNLDLTHKGWRGGSLRTRYFGRLEGVSPDLKEKVVETAKKSGLSVSEWLELNLKKIIK